MTMHSLFTSNTPTKHPLLLRVVYITLFNTAIAIFVSFVLLVKGNFFQNWVFSMLIGSSITILIDVMRWLFWKNENPNRLLFLLICVIAAPLGYYIGTTLGFILFGIPTYNISYIIGKESRILVTMCIVISLFTGAFYWNQARRAELKVAAEKETARIAGIEKQAMQAQLQLLQAQIEPHMLFNTLANLQGLIAIDANRAQYMLEQLIVYLRASLQASRTATTTLQHEFTLMKAYLELLAIRMGKRLTYTLDLPADLQGCKIAPMLLQPLVENAIKHGVEPKMEGGNIHVTARQQDGFLQLCVSDTGLGLPAGHDTMQTTENKQDGDKHIGNANVRDRLLALYGTDASFKLQANQPQGATALISIPLGALQHA